MLRHAPAVWLAVLLTLSPTLRGLQQTGDRLAGALKERIDATVKELVVQTSVPSAVLGVVQNGRIVYTAAFGNARLSPRLAATTAMRYPIGSISKQFTAACVLLLAQEGKLSLDDHVSRFFPELTRSDEVTLRNLLSHTSGYRDYAPQDYTIPAWTRPTTPESIVREWGTLPLDFEPGTQYQYSNTNYNIAGLIVEKASGERFWPFLQARVLEPLGLSRTIDLDRQRGQLEPTGYFRYALAPLRPAVLEAPGWYFADGSLAMPIDELLTWDISLMNRSLLAPASYDAMETEMRLKNGQGVRYGLGVSLTVRDGHRLVSHSGEVGGFVSSNLVFPDDKIAVAVLTNQEASAAAARIGRAVSAMLLAPAAVVSTEASAAERQAREVLADLQQGKINRALFTDNANFFFTAAALADHRTSLSPLGAVASVRQTSTSQRGGMTFRAFEVQFAKGTKLTLSTFTTIDGKLEQFLLDVAA
jgi:CubicO group peptidase (beta-lactamase class C family)